MTRAVLLGLLLWCAPYGDARAQWLPPSQWEEPTIIDASQPPAAQQLDPGEATAIPAQEYPQPMVQEQIEALARRAADATVPVRARFRRDPLLLPETIEIVGAATAVTGPTGEPIWITASQLVDGAELVVFDLPGGPVPAQVSEDLRFGLAILEPLGEVPPARLALPLSQAGADCREEAITANQGYVGATMGAGEDRYRFYQVNTLGVILGYPLINRDGEVIGIGSHYYPVNPAFSLAVPAAAVQEFLVQQAQE